MKWQDQQILAESNLRIELADSAGQAKKTPTFEMEAYTGKAIRQWWSRHPIVADLEGMEIPERPIPIDLQHNRYSGGVGHTTSVEITKGDQPSLLASGVISRATEAARDVVESSKNGFPWQSSMTLDILAMEEIKEGTVKVNGRSFDAPLYVARKTRLAAIAFVDLGADDDTSATVAASKRNQTQPKGHTMDDEQTQTQSTIEAAGAAPQNPPPAPAAPAASSGVIADLEAMEKNAEVEATRQNRIRIAAQSVVDMRPDLAKTITAAAKTAIEEKTDAGSFELEMLRAGRDHGGIGGARGDRSTSDEVISASLCLAGGMDASEVEKEFGERAIEAAEKRFGNSLGLADAVLMCAQANGFTGVSIKADIDGALRAASQQMHQIAAGSTLSLPNILSNVLNKYLRKGFNYVEPEWRKVTKIGTVRDFKPKTTATLTGDMIMKKLPSSGEIEHGKPGEETYTNQADTFARMLSVSRQALINDDLGALTEVPEKHGAGAARAFCLDFWTEYQENAGNFYHADNSNLLTGGGSALSISALTAAVNALRSQTDPDDNPLGLSGKFKLVVPIALEQTAYQLVNSMEIRGESGVFGVANPHQGRFEIVASQYLTSATAWFLQADPNQLPVIESVFLNGNQVPTIQSSQAEFSVLGIQWRGFWDFGNNKQEYRAAVKNAGA